MNSIFNRLKEPSTWAGIGILLSLFGVDVGGTLEGVAPYIAALGGAAAVALPESKR